MVWLELVLWSKVWLKGGFAVWVTQSGWVGNADDDGTSKGRSSRKTAANGATGSVPLSGIGSTMGAANTDSLAAACLLNTAAVSVDCGLSALLSKYKVDEKPVVAVSVAVVLVGTAASVGEFCLSN